MEFFSLPLTPRFTLLFSVSFAAKAFYLGHEIKVLLSSIYTMTYHFLFLYSSVVISFFSSCFLISCNSQYEIPQARVLSEAGRAQEMIMLSNHLPVSSQIILNCIVLRFISGLIVLSLYPLDLISI